MIKITLNQWEKKYPNHVMGGINYGAKKQSRILEMLWKEKERSNNSQSTTCI